MIGILYLELLNLDIKLKQIENLPFISILEIAIKTKKILQEKIYEKWTNRF